MDRNAFDLPSDMPSDIPVSLSISPEFMDTWTPLPDNAAGGCDVSRKIIGFRELRRTRLLRSRGMCLVSELKCSVEAPSLIEAAQNSDTSRLLQMLSSGTNPCVCDEKGRTALHVASAKGLDNIVRVLLEYGADPNQRDRIGNTPFHLAVTSNKTDTMTLLINAGCEIDTYQKSGPCSAALVKNRIHRLHRNTHLSLHDRNREQLQTIKLQQVIALKHQREGDAQSSEALARLSSLSITSPVSDTNSFSDTNSVNRPTDPAAVIPRLSQLAFSISSTSTGGASQSP